MNHQEHQAAHDAGFQVDLLGRPIKVGDTILTKGYSSPTINHRATVKKMHRKTFTVDLEISYWIWGAYDGTTRSYPNRKRHVEIREMKRTGFDCIVINEQLPISEALAEEFLDDHPEIFI